MQILPEINSEKIKTNYFFIYNKRLIDALYCYYLNMNPFIDISENPEMRKIKGKYGCLLDKGLPIPAYNLLLREKKENLTLSPIKSRPSQAKQALIRLSQWLNMQWSDADPADRPFIRVEQGLLIEEKGFQLMIAQYTVYASVDALLKTLAEFLVSENNALMVC